MKNNIPLFALGAVGILFMMSKKSSTKTVSKTNPENKPVDEESPKTDDQGKIDLVLDNIPQIKTCSINEYYDSKKKECVVFWNEHTEPRVKKEFDDILKAKNIAPDVDKICAEIMVNNEYQQNPVALKIIMETVSNLWGISIEHLPPKKTDPQWILTVWTRVYDLYYKHICNFETGWN